MSKGMGKLDAKTLKKIKKYESEIANILKDITSEWINMGEDKLIKISMTGSAMLSMALDILKYTLSENDSIEHLLIVEEGIRERLDDIFDEELEIKIRKEMEDDKK